MVNTVSPKRKSFVKSTRAHVPETIHLLQCSFCWRSGVPVYLRARSWRQVSATKCAVATRSPLEVTPANFTNPLRG